MGELTAKKKDNQTFLNKLEEIDLLKLPKGQYAIFGSGPMAIRGLREANDIDVIVKPELWSNLIKKYTPHDEKLIKVGNIEIWKDCINLTHRMEEVIDSADYLKGYPFVTLPDTLLWKKHLNREKDQNDIRVIERFLELVPGVYQEKPNNFSPDLIATACYLRYQNKLLFLQKAKYRWSSEKWGIPCGTVNEREDISQAMKREIHEEVGLKIDNASLNYLSHLYMTSPERIQYVFHMFSYEVEEEISIFLSKEHMDYKWVSLKDTATLTLIPGQKEALAYYKKR